MASRDTRPTGMDALLATATALAHQLERRVAMLSTLPRNSVTSMRNGASEPILGAVRKSASEPAPREPRSEARRRNLRPAHCAMGFGIAQKPPEHTAEASQQSELCVHLSPSIEQPLLWFEQVRLPMLSL